MLEFCLKIKNLNIFFSVTISSMLFKIKGVISIHLQALYLLIFEVALKLGIPVGFDFPFFFFSSFPLPTGKKILELFVQLECKLH